MSDWLNLEVAGRSRSCSSLKLYITLNILQSEHGAKRLKLADGGTAAGGGAAAGGAAPPTASAPPPATNTTKLGGIRRSTRHRKLRGEKALIVSANQTLKELKIQVNLPSLAAVCRAMYIDNSRAVLLNGWSLREDKEVFSPTRKSWPKSRPRRSKLTPLCFNFESYFWVSVHQLRSTTLQEYILCISWMNTSLFCLCRLCTPFLWRRLTRTSP